MTSVVPARARELAARLSALFERDVEIVGRLNDAQRRLRDANERLWSGLAPDAFGLVYDGAAPAGQSQIAVLMRTRAAPAGRMPTPRCSGRCSRSTRRSIVRFCEYQSACEERRQLAVDVGELSQQLTEVLCARRLQCGRRAGRRRARARRGGDPMSVGEGLVSLVSNHTPMDQGEDEHEVQLSELSERQLFALRRRLAAGVHDPALTLRGALLATCGVARARTVAAGRASCTARTPT